MLPVDFLRLHIVAYLVRLWRDRVAQQVFHPTRYDLLPHLLFYIFPTAFSLLNLGFQLIGLDLNLLLVVLLINFLNILFYMIFDY